MMTITIPHQWFYAFARMAAIISFLPGLSSDSWQWRMRLVLAVLLCTISLPSLRMPSEFEASGLVCLSEVALGLVFGFSLRIVLQLFALMGQSISLLSGYAFARLIEPMYGLPDTLLPQFISMAAITLFFQLDFHLVFVQGVNQLFTQFPLGCTILWYDVFTKTAVALSNNAMTILRICIPMSTLLLVVYLGIGFIGRNKIELNIFAVGLPVITLLVLILLYLKIDNILLVTRLVFENYFGAVFNV